MHGWPQAIVFDLDGTLVDSFPGIALALDRALVAKGRPPLGLEWVRAHVGRGLRRLVEDAVGEEAAGAVDELVHEFGVHYDRLLERETPAYPGAGAAVTRLARRARLAVASNKPVRWSRRLVDHLGWSESVRVVVGPEDAGAPKPDPAMVRVALERLGCEPGQALLVGDMTVDVETGRGAGLPVVGIATDLENAVRLRAAGALAVLPGVGALPDWLDGVRPTAATSSPRGRHDRTPE